MKATEELRALARDPITALVIIVVFSVLVLFVGYPLFEVARAVVTGPGGELTFEPLAALSLQRHFVQPIANSLLLGVLVAFAGTAVGLLFAFAALRTDLPFRGVLKKVATLPIITPPFVIALSAILLFGRNGVVTRGVFLDVFGVNLYAAGFDIYGLGGLVFVETLAYFPTAYLLLVSVLGSIDPSIEEAARSLGAGRMKTFVRVTLPLMMPALFASFLLIFIESLADFGNPLTLGGRFNVLSVQAYLQITGNNDLAGGSALALALLVPSVAVYVLQGWLLEKRSFVTVTGKASRPSGVAVGPLGKWLVGAAVLAVVALVALFYGFVLLGSFVKLWGADSTLTLSNYAKAFALSRRDIIDSVLLAAISAPVSALVAIVIAWLLERRRFPGRRLMELFALLTFAVPGTVVGIGYALAFSKPPVVLTGTATIIVALMVFRNIPVGLKAASAALKQIDRSIEEAAANLGASPIAAFFRVTVPMLTPAIYSALIYGFVRAITSVSAVIFVVSGSWNLLTVAILGYVDNSSLSQAAALSVILVVIVLVVFEGLRRLLARTTNGRFSEL
jgi:iron(III) transport system permease protein